MATSVVIKKNGRLFYVTKPVCFKKQEIGGKTVLTPQNELVLAEIPEQYTDTIVLGNHIFAVPAEENTPENVGRNIYSDFFDVQYGCDSHTSEFHVDSKYKNIEFKLKSEGNLAYAIRNDKQLIYVQNQVCSYYDPFSFGDLQTKIYNNTLFVFFKRFSSPFISTFCSSKDPSWYNFFENPKLKTSSWHELPEKCKIESLENLKIFPVYAQDGAPTYYFLDLNSNIAFNDQGESLESFHINFEKKLDKVTRGFFDEYRKKYQLPTIILKENDLLFNVLTPLYLEEQEVNGEKVLVLKNTYSAESINKKYTDVIIVNNDVFAVSGKNSAENTFDDFYDIVHSFVPSTVTKLFYEQFEIKADGDYVYVISTAKTFLYCSRFPDHTTIKGHFLQVKRFDDKYLFVFKNNNEHNIVSYKAYAENFVQKDWIDFKTPTLVLENLTVFYVKSTYKELPNCAFLDLATDIAYAPNGELLENYAIMP